jgi:co-chaperonin GroES (HSP10)
MILKETTQTSSDSKEVPKTKLALEEKYKEEAKLEKSKRVDETNVDSIQDELPTPTGWRLLVLPYKGQGKTKGGVILTDQHMEERGYTTVTALVLKMGEECYKNEERFPNGPWCKKGDWIIFGRYAGSRFGIEGGEVRILNDDEIIAVVKDPEDILQYK